jgi:hypothetical protein
MKRKIAMGEDRILNHDRLCAESDVAIAEAQVFLAQQRVLEQMREDSEFRKKVLNNPEICQMLNLPNQGGDRLDAAGRFGIAMMIPFYQIALALALLKVGAIVIMALIEFVKSIGG